MPAKTSPIHQRRKGHIANKFTFALSKKADKVRFTRARDFKKYKDRVAARGKRLPQKNMTPGPALRPSFKRTDFIQKA
jgi:hypothetical protein